jgi:hypothetical protein
MIRPIRVIASAIQEELDGISSEMPGDCAQADDPDLDLLVRHAVRQELASHDGGQVWQQLSKRVKGPFGSMAIEEPAHRGRPMPVLTDSTEGAERQPDSMRHSLFRTAEATFSMR